jgi:glycosyltransferase involved in cell wall biosynthesis
MTDPLGQSQVLPYLTGLSSLGHKISLISCEKPENLNENRKTIEAICDKANIEWNHISYTKKPPILSTVKDVFALRKAATKIAKSKTIDIVHCRSYLAAMVGQTIKRKFGSKFVFDMRGFWADERVDGNIWNLKNPAYKTVYNFFKRKEKSFLENADAVISLTESGKQEMLGWDVKLDPEKIHVIPCCADFEHFDFSKTSPEKTAQIRNRLNIPESALVFSYLGSIGTWYLVEEMLSFFRKAMSKHPSAHLLFITKDDPEQIRTLAAAASIPQEKLAITPASRAEVPEILEASDIGFFFIKPSFSKKSSSPTKLAEILGMGKPVVCNTGVGDIGSIFADGDFGIAFDVDSLQNWDNAIDQLDDLRQLKPSAIRAKGMRLFSLESGIAAYQGIYQSL